MVPCTTVQIVPGAMRKYFSGRRQLSVSSFAAIACLLLAATTKSAEAFLPSSIDINNRHSPFHLLESASKVEPADDEVINGSSSPELVGENDILDDDCANQNVHNHADHAHKHKSTHHLF